MISTVKEIPVCVRVYWENYIIPFMIIIADFKQVLDIFVIHLL